MNDQGTRRDRKLELIASGSILADGNEQVVIELDLPYPATIQGWINLTNEAGGDTLVVKEYVKINAAGPIQHSQDTYNGPVALPALQTGPTTARWYRLAIQQTAGVNRNYGYEIYKGLK
jgi:hypothetical protein